MANFLESVLNAVGQGLNSITISLSAGAVTVIFPVLPAELMVSVSMNHTTVNLNNYGEYLMMGKTGLKTLTLSGFFPAQDYPFALSMVRPYILISQLDAMRTGGSVCQLTVSGTTLSMPCLISGFQYGEKDGSGDVYYELQLTEYRYVAAEKDGKTDKKTGLKKRKETFWQKLKKNVTYYPGDSIGTVIGRAVGKSVTLNDEEYTKFDIFRSVVRSGGIKPGDVLKVTSLCLKRNEKNVPVAKSESKTE